MIFRLDMVVAKQLLQVLVAWLEVVAAILALASLSSYIGYIWRWRGVLVAVCPL
jgi:hypothetical protein